MRVGELFDMLKRRESVTDLEDIKAMVPASERAKIGTGVVTTGDDSEIRFENVDIVSPSGQYLAKDLTFTVKRGVNVLVSGPNGCGKSSLFRILGGLWPLCGGHLTKPPVSHLFYIPQKPYLCPGTLRDQVTYPDVLKDGSQDKTLDELMSLVELEHIVQREGGWDSVRDWFSVLSGGEKQRVAMARLFYHRPAYGILDECTSAVSIDVEAKIYQTCAKLGITIFTVSHRPQLRHHHDYQLRFDGEGGWEWSAIEKTSNQ